MNRTTRLKLGYIAVFLTVAALVVTLLVWVAGPLGFFFAALLTILPGRLQGVFYRDFFRGRRLLAAGKPEEAIPEFERFLETIRDRPGLKKLVWLQWAVYSPDVEVMTLNNLGTAQYHLGELDVAEGYLREALRLDPVYPIAYYNLALIAAERDDDAKAERLLGEAHRLGYTRGSLDQVLGRAGNALARLEGRGPPQATAPTSSPPTPE
ncbi:tetratricopeptide repeat protein [Longimicrobium sp.]|jgi:tetratricopeptide (TPR) repeat protein|uniref:tetratricopeptide repeat protein n=1 Tax=Longimicrobium sp. TaxID=2029185 RepID=UPI002EDAF41D